MWQICCRIVESSSVGGVRWYCCTACPLPVFVAGVRVVEFGPFSTSCLDENETAGRRRQITVAQEGRLEKITAVLWDAVAGRRGHGNSRAFVGASSDVTRYRSMKVIYRGDLQERLFPSTSKPGGRAPVGAH